MVDVPVIGSNPTPLQNLEDAVHAYAASIEEGAVVSAWVLGFEASRLTDNPDLIPLGFASDYSMGLSTSADHAIGLAHMVERRIRAAAEQEGK